MGQRLGHQRRRGDMVIVCRRGDRHPHVGGHHHRREHAKGTGQRSHRVDGVVDRRQKRRGWIARAVIHDEVEVPILSGAVVLLVFH